MTFLFFFQKNGGNPKLFETFERDFRRLDSRFLSLYSLQNDDDFDESDDDFFL